MKKSIRRFALVLCFMFLLLPVLSISSAAVNQYDYVNVPSVVQAKSMWCWAACAEMVGRAIYPESTITQYDVVRVYKGSASNPYPDDGGTIVDMAEGVQYVANDMAIAYYMSGTLTNDKIVDSIAHGYPIITGLLCSYYGYTWGHAVVIRGTRFLDGSSGMFNYIEYVDPADGYTYNVLYEDFLNGSVFIDGSLINRQYIETVGIYYEGMN